MTILYNIEELSPLIESVERNLAEREHIDDLHTIRDSLIYCFGCLKADFKLDAEDVKETFDKKNKELYDFIEEKLDHESAETIKRRYAALLGIEKSLRKKSERSYAARLGRQTRLIQDANNAIEEIYAACSTNNFKNIHNLKKKILKICEPYVYES